MSKLISSFKDINNFTGFKDGAFKYYLGKYEADLLLLYIEQLENNRDKALKIIDSYDLGKYDYSIPAGGIIELREVLKGDSE